MSYGWRVDGYARCTLAGVRVGNGSLYSSSFRGCDRTLALSKAMFITTERLAWYRVIWWKCLNTDCRSTMVSLYIDKDLCTP